MFLEESRWEVLKPGGDTPPCLQEHSAVAYKDAIYVFGGELGFSACNETPLWVYNVKVSFAISLERIESKMQWVLRAVLHKGLHLD